MAVREMKVLMDGATGRLCRTQHLMQSVLAIRADGGVCLPNGDRIVPIPVLLGRNAEKLSAIASQFGDLAWSTDREVALADPTVQIYFDAAATAGRVERTRQAIAAGKHIYLEKPVAVSLDDALDLVRRAQEKGLKHGTVQDKLSLPGLRKLARLRREGFFGDLYSVRLDFGWWVFDGEYAPAQRSSWNYRKADGGGLILDMFPHWRYIIETIVAPIRSVSCRATTRVPHRRDEAGRPYTVDVEDEVFAILEAEGGILVQVDSSWASRVKRDELLRMQVDGAEGSAVAGIHHCFVQSLVETPKPKWNIEAIEPRLSDDHWAAVPDVEGPCNGYRHGWELFLSHVAADTPFPYTLLEGAKGVQLVEACHRSNNERRWVDLPALKL
ncbi:MAG: Gfo/Idh/MocA family protein [Pseudorhodoplanes sp.]